MTQGASSSVWVLHARSMTSLSGQDQQSLLIAFQCIGLLVGTEAPDITPNGVDFSFLSFFSAWLSNLLGCWNAMMWTLTWKLSVPVGMTRKRRRAAVGNSNTKLGNVAAAENVMHRGHHCPQRNREAVVWDLSHTCAILFFTLYGGLLLGSAVVMEVRCRS